MPTSDTIKAAWITGLLGVAGTIAGAVLTNGYGLFPSPRPTPTFPTPPPTQAAFAASPPTEPATSSRYTTRPPTEPATSSRITAPPPNAAAVPASYQGTWTGVVTQSNNVSYQLTLKIGAGSVGTGVGSWQIPIFGCSGVLVLESGGGPLVVRQNTTFNPNLQCFSQVEGTVTLQGSSGLTYQILGATTTNGQFIKGNPVLGSGTLTRL